MISAMEKAKLVYILKLEYCGQYDNLVTKLDLGLNHIVWKWCEPTDPRANLFAK